MTTSYELLSSDWRRHIRRLRKMSSTEGLLWEPIPPRPWQLGQGIDADRAATEMLSGVGDDRPHVLAGGPAEQEQVPVLGLAHQDPRLAADGAGAQSPHRSDRRPQVQRAEAREHLARQRADDRHRREVAGDVGEGYSVGPGARLGELRSQAVGDPGLADDERPGRGQPAPPGLAGAYRLTEPQLGGALTGDAVELVRGALELELAEMGDVGPASGAACRRGPGTGPNAVVMRGFAPAVTDFELRAGGAGLALHGRVADDPVRGGRAG